ncbi:MAG: hypothetical protein HYV26_05845, partial [Candidatus Hydrogenedentes bacterium]|nr:hypothetical protein [Candidatus Hydrogenedentota bacterium]
MLETRTVNSFPDLVRAARETPAELEGVPWESCVQAARAFSEAERRKLRERHERGEPGADIIRALADVADTVVRGVLELCAAQVRERKPVLGRVALCALGGYG